MPALITHRLFGEEALPALPEHLRATASQRTAFLLGNQGPDPFFFAVTTPRGSVVREMGHRMHNERMAACFDTLRAGVSRLPAAVRDTGLAFVCGLLGHYALDRTAHPYVYAHEFALCDDNPELHDAYHEVHALIESDIDAGMLHALRGTTTAQVAPVSAIEGDVEAERAGGALLADCALSVFGLPLRPGDYAGGLADMRLCYRTIEPAGSRRSRGIGALERRARPHSQMEALAHRSDLDETCASMNPKRRPWTNPFLPADDPAAASTDSFRDRFDTAQRLYRLLLSGLLDGTPACELTRGINYEGQQIGPDETAVAFGRPL